MANNAPAQSKNRLRFIIRALLAVMLVAPLFFLPTQFPFAAAKGFFITGMACLIIATSVALVIMRRDFFPRLPSAAWAIAPYVLWLVITSSIGTSPSNAWWSTFDRGDSLIVLIAAIGAAYALFAAMRQKDISTSIAWTWAIGGCAVVATKYIGMLMPDSLLASGGTMGNSSLAAAYLIFPLFASLWLFFKDEGKKKMLPAIAAFFILTSPFFLSVADARTGLLSFIGEAQATTLSIVIGAVAGGVFFFSRSKKKSIRIASMILAVVGLAGSIGIAVLFFSSGSQIQEAFIARASPTRFLYGRIAIEGIAEHPITGYGAGNYPVIYQEYYDPINLTREYLNEGWIDKPHNLLLEIAVSGGLPALAFYLFIYCAILIGAIRLTQKGLIDRHSGALFFGLFIAYFSQNLFLFETPVTMLFFWMATAWLISHAPSSGEKSVTPLFDSPQARNTIIALVWIMACTGIYFFAWQPGHEAVALKRIQRATVQERAQNIETIFAISPMGNISDEAAFIETYADLYIQKLPSFTLQDKAVISSELATYARIVAERSHKVNNFRLLLAGSKIANARAAYANDDIVRLAAIDDAREYAAEAMDISPKNQQSYVEMAKADIQSRDIESAILWLRRAVLLEPRVASLQTLLLKVIASTGNTGDFERALRDARASIPGFSYKQ